MEQARKRLFFGVAVLALAAVGTATVAHGDSCTNTCVTVAIPSSDGVQTKLDGTADAVLWPPGNDFRLIHIAALNDHGVDCDVTINDVRQDEAPRVSRNGKTLDDAVDCNNEGDSSTIGLRGERARNGDGRAYHISFRLDDPDCIRSGKTDEVLIAVPRDDAATSLKSYADDGDTLTASYAGSELQCTPQQDDRLAGLSPSDSNN
jgi:hypothetical protein